MLVLLELVADWLLGYWCHGFYRKFPTLSVAQIPLLAPPSLIIAYFYDVTYYFTVKVYGPEYISADLCVNFSTVDESGLSLLRIL